MDEDPFKHLKISKEEKDPEKTIDPLVWFHTWVRLLLIILALGFVVMGIGELLIGRYL